MLYECLEQEDNSVMLNILTDIPAYLLSRVLPTSFILAILAVISYAVMGFRFVYDVLVTGHGLALVLEEAKFLMEESNVDENTNANENSFISKQQLFDNFRNRSQIDISNEFDTVNPDIEIKS
ncbi:uncharacterized protein LOC129219968 [Uloborus diversus]|uniref:uncharacterized protein LOC129219968 n=1 Tax=Uloborus diversus TaxID=327109 RepID=UPI00240A94F2|nr:uncharacterized protein LOC129219968 [Uloborus diversus]